MRESDDPLHKMMAPQGGPPERAHARRGSLLQTFKAVAWAFLGIRGRGAHEADIANLNPIHLVIVAIVCAAVFVTSLLFIVRWAVGAAD